VQYKFALIGYPITHSLSPWIHEHFLQATNLEGSYTIYEISPEKDFANEMEKLKKEEFHGFNVTVPYKEKMIPYLDEIDSQAKKIGAVNTVLQKDGRWIGYNTDGIGYVRALFHKFQELRETKNIKILLLGAGGAAKGILHALLYEGFQHITIANRSLERAEILAKAKEGIEVISLDEAARRLDRFSLIIQTTSVGMKPKEEDVIISLENIKENTIVSDIVYQPIETRFLQEAKERGARIHYGHSMLLYQAQYAFEIWTEKEPDAQSLDEKLKQTLEG